MANDERAQSMSRVRLALRCLPLLGALAIGLILAIGIGNLHGWDWALAGAGVLAASWLTTFWVIPTPRIARIGARLQPVAAKVGTGAVLLWLLMLGACGYLLVLMAPYSTGIQSLVVGAPLVVHVLIIVLLIVVTYHLLFPIIEPKRRAMLVWRFTPRQTYGQVAVRPVLRADRLHVDRGVGPAASPAGQTRRGPVLPGGAEGRCGPGGAGVLD
jgi:hypothetical protein